MDVLKTKSRHCCDDLVNIFNRLFCQSERTILVKGGKEPVYRPAQQSNGYHQIIFTHDYYASALHEIAHWCIAGEQRRLQMDYGYWYYPDGRNKEQQKAFEKVEAKPQALEWIFSWQAGYVFKVSLDNLHGEVDNYNSFKQAVVKEVQNYSCQGIPSRGRYFQQALGEFYNRPTSLDLTVFKTEFC